MISSSLITQQCLYQPSKEKITMEEHVRTFREDEVLEMLTHTWQLLLINADQEAFNYLDIMIRGIKGGEL